MNIDIKVPGTPANARRLLVIRESLDMDLSPDIMELANHDMITEEQIKERIPQEIRERAGANLLKVVQHSQDWNQRFVLPTVGGVDPIALALACTVFSGRKALIIHDDPLVLKMTRKWLTFMTTKSLTATADATDEDVLFASIGDMNHQHVTDTRKRVLILMNQPKPFMSAKVTTKSLHLEYPHIIGTAHSRARANLMPEFDQGYGISEVQAASAMLGVIHPEVWRGSGLDHAARIKAAKRFGAYLELLRD